MCGTGFNSRKITRSLSDHADQLAALDPRSFIELFLLAGASRRSIDLCKHRRGHFLHDLGNDGKGSRRQADSVSVVRLGRRN